MEKTYGRITLLANITEKELLSLGQKKQDEAIIEILENSKPLHDKNRQDSEYLKSFYYGDQDIKNKVKQTRPEINNKTVENWAYACVDFKKTFLLGKPIQYVQFNSSDSAEISTLNKFVRYENKKAKDMDLFEDVLVCGRGFRYINKDKVGSEDEAPFEIINCPVEDTEVVYSSRLGNEQLFAFIDTPMYDYQPSMGDNGVEVLKTVLYDVYQVYLRNKVLTYSNKGGSLQRIGKPQPLIWNEHIIIESYINRKRISLIELGKDLFNDINYLESLDKDDMEQFVNAIMVFTNAEVSKEDLDDIKEMGAVCISSTEQKKASVDLLQGRLNAQDTQTYYNRLLTSLHQILAIPIASDSGTVTSGDTGKAKLTGQGFTSAGIRAEGDECMFGMCDLKALKVILAICRNTPNSGITTLKVSEVEPKFQRDMSDNILVKTQALQNLYSCDIPREIANSIVNLFGDSAKVSQEQQKLFGNQVSQQDKGSSSNDFGTNGETTNAEDMANFQNNEITNKSELDNQGQ